jgi:hypothetical protein
MSNERTSEAYQMNETRWKRINQSPNFTDRKRQGEEQNETNRRENKIRSGTPSKQHASAHEDMLPPFAIFLDGVDRKHDFDQLAG